MQLDTSLLYESLIEMDLWVIKNVYTVLHISKYNTLSSMTGFVNFHHLSSTRMNHGPCMHVKGFVTSHVTVHKTGVRVVVMLTVLYIM